MKLLEHLAQLRFTTHNARGRGVTVTIVSNVNYIKKKAKRYQSLGTKQFKNILICSQIFLITNRLFDLVQKLDRQKRMYLVNPKIQRSKKNISAWSRNYLAKAERFYLTQKLKDQSKTFQLGLEIILVKPERYQ